MPTTTDAAAHHPPPPDVPPEHANRSVYTADARPRSCDGLWRSLVSALVLGTKGPGFKSRQPDEK